MKVLHLYQGGAAGGIESLGVEIAKFSKDENFFYFIFGGGVKEQEIRKYTDDVFVTHVTKANFFREFKKFYHYCLDNKIELVVCEGAGYVPFLFIGKLQRKKKTIPTIIYLHGPLETSWISKRLYGFVEKRAKGIVAISEFVKKSVEKEGFPTEKITVIYNGIDTQKFTYQQRTELKEPIHLIYVGRLIEGKGVQNILNILSKANFKFHFTIVGDGNYRQKLQDLTEKLGIQENVTFALTQSNVNSYLQKADFFIHLPEWEEGFGLTIVEAMSAGVPCISWYSGGIPEIIQSGKDGILLNKEGTSEEFNEWMNHFLNSNSDYARISKSGREKALSFDSRKYVCELTEYLQKHD